MPRTADRLLVNGIILTQDEKLVQVSQLAISGKNILAAGDDLSCYRNELTEVVDLQGKVVVPGFIDAHIHFLWGGENLLAIPLQKADSKASFIELISTFAERYAPGSWLKGGGWNEHLFLDGSLPHRSWLDEAAPGYPMILHRHDGHSGIASSAALKMAGITRATPDPEGGVIERDDQGEPTGILKDAAMGLVLSLAPPESEAELVKHFEAAQHYLLQNGVTAVGDMIYDMTHFHFLQKMAHQHKLKIRVTVYTPLLKWSEMKQLIDEGLYEDEWFQFKGLKAFSDGSLGSHTALMIEPYEDTPGFVGIYDTDWEDQALVIKTISEADLRGYQTVVHAIGDRANREVLDVFQTVIEQNGHRDRRFRIEHAQHIAPEDQKRFAELGVIASVQPTHCVDDARYAESLLGKRCDYAYPFRTLQRNGTQLALGSDWPVSPANPVSTIHSTIKRAGWHMEEALDFNTSLKAHTADAAYAGFRDHDIGRIIAGYLADLVILDPAFLELDSYETPPADLIRSVYVNGEKKADY
ncbi:MAG: amidohydrolase [Candidatus Marinimicrobia bacterium]|nr:amidohydrolase [Candidatus Neomarinimicrobiota bacterium]